MTKASWLSCLARALGRGMQEKEPNDHHFAQDFVAGWFGGVAGLIVGHPLDTVKARLQLDGVPPQYRGTFDCFRQIVTTEGVRALYKGLVSPMVGMAFINAIVFGVQHNLMKALDRTYFNSFVAGGTAGAVQSVICCPVELVKLRMQAQHNPTELFHFSTPTKEMIYRDPWDAVTQIYRKYGVRGLFKGMGVTVAREVPGFGAYFATYDFLCNMSMKLFGTEGLDSIHPVTLCICGGLSGINAWIVSYPIDVVKSRLQVDGMFSKEIYSGAIDCSRKTYAEGLATGHNRWYIFFRGLNSTMARGFLVNAVTFPTVVLILRYWRRD